ncbi:hypothetical protein [Absidia glauca]|uniref:Uncharacterized protein n=1 Tax=Absidia glauca TaxID=4829 RepID=A0A168NH12_ABSGL|nr:hypothetical protein [Absidia glauca]
MLASMNVMTSLGLINSGFTKLLSSRIYQQFLRPQMEHGLAITPLTKTLVTKKLEQAQNDSIRRFHGAHSLSSTVITRHLGRIPPMQTRVDLLRFKYLHRIATLPADSLLSIIIVVSTSAPRRLTATSPWIRLSHHLLWHQYKSLEDPPPTQRFLNAHLDTLHTAASSHSTLLQQCRPKRGIDPILHVPMDRRHRSRLIRWRLVWLTGGSPKLCACGQTISKRHIISLVPDMLIHCPSSSTVYHVNPPHMRPRANGGATGQSSQQSSWPWNNSSTPTTKNPPLQTCSKG